MLRFLIVLLFLFLSFRTVSQVPFTREFRLNEVGSPVGVNDLLYEPGGFLWLATDDGIYSFNGSEFKSYADTINAAAVALTRYRGQIIAAYENGSVARVAKSRVIDAPAFSASDREVISLGSSGNILAVNTEAGTTLYAWNRYLQLNKSLGLSDDFVYETEIRSDKLLLATDRGINIITRNGGKLIIGYLDQHSGLPDNIVRVLAAVPGADLTWIGTQEGGLALLDDKRNRIVPVRMQGSWAWGQINDILPVSATEAWVATEADYLLRIRRYGDSIDVVPYTFENVRFNKLVLDKAGNIWCATNYGLMLCTALYAGQIRLSDFRLDHVSSMTCDPEGTLWFTQQQHLFKLAAGSTKPERILQAKATITSLFADQAGSLWIGTYGEGLHRLHINSGKTEKIQIVRSLTDGHILSISGTGRKVWVASLNGVEELASSATGKEVTLVRHHSRASGLSSDYVYQLYADRKGKLWMATDGGGVCMYDGERYHIYDSAAGFDSKVVYSLAEDRSGTLWAGTLEKGLYRFSEGRWKNMDWVDGSSQRNIYSVTAGKDGNLFVVTPEGIFQWSSEKKQYRLFNRKLGMDIDSVSAEKVR
ncbi:MAG: hypothetical protein EOP49_00135 [Sphingobacteriales bacterium]|nr:MAG: hypothetical protein EOP49_00135 [Sphingobacteriales bacterium]